MSRNNLAGAYWYAGRTAEAIALQEVTLGLYESKLGPDHRDTLRCRANLAGAYESIGRWVDSERLERDVLARRRKAVGPDSPLIAHDLDVLARNLMQQSRESEAEPLLREALAIHEEASPDAWWRYDDMSVLGGVLLGQGQYSRAEPMVVAGYERMKAREAQIPVPSRSILLEAAERIIRLYEAWDKPDRAAAWKARLGMRDLPAEVFARP
jgi:tetratricopeptide (TPR) repeat protein